MKCKDYTQGIALTDGLICLPTIDGIFYLWRQKVKVFAMLLVIVTCARDRPSTNSKKFIPGETVMGKCQPSIKYLTQTR